MDWPKGRRVLKFDSGLWSRLRREGSEGSKGSKGGGIAFGDAFCSQRYGIYFMSPVLHDEEEKPSSPSKGAPKATEDRGVSCIKSNSSKFRTYPQGFAQLLPGEGA